MAMNNSLAEVHPELITEWSEKNLPLTPDDITFGTGGTLVMIPEEKSRDAEYWLQLVIRYQVTIWNSVPILLDMLLICAEEKKVKLPLKTALLSGDWIGMDLPQRLAGSTSDCKFIAMGGATEASMQKKLRCI